MPFARDSGVGEVLVWPSVLVPLPVTGVPFVSRGNRERDGESDGEKSRQEGEKCKHGVVMLRCLLGDERKRRERMESEGAVIFMDRSFRHLGWRKKLAVRCLPVQMHCYLVMLMFFPCQLRLWISIICHP